MAVSLLLWCIKTIGSRRWFPSISWKFRWSRNGRKVDEIEHRGHQIEDFDSKINIPRSKYIWKAEKKSKRAINIFQNFVKLWPDLMVYIYIYNFLLSKQKRNCHMRTFVVIQTRTCGVISMRTLVVI